MSSRAASGATTSLIRRPPSKKGLPEPLPEASLCFCNFLYAPGLSPSVPNFLLLPLARFAMNFFARFARALLLALLPIGGLAAPHWQIGESTLLLVTGEATAGYDSNVFLTSSEEETEDTSLTFSPGLELRLGREGAALGIVVAAKANIRRYQDLGELDNETLGLIGKVRYLTGNQEFSGVVAIRQEDQNTSEVKPTGNVPALIERLVTTGDVVWLYRASNKTATDIGLTYSSISFEETNALYNDSEEIGVPVNLYYRLSPRLSISGGYRYRRTMVDELDGQDSKDHFFNIGVRTEASEKLKASLRLGYQTRSYDRTSLEDQNGFSAQSALEWSPTARTRFGASLSRDFGTSSFGSGTEETRLGISASQDFADRWTVSGGLNVSQIDYNETDGRTDDRWSASLGVEFRPIQLLSLGASYQYDDNSSSREGSSYERQSLTVRASLRY